MSASGQAHALKEFYKRDYETWQKSEQMKKEIKTLRGNLFMMRKNVRIPSQKRANSRTETKKPSSEQKLFTDNAEAHGEVGTNIFYNSPTETRRENGQATQELTLPSIKGQSPRRAVSAGYVNKDSSAIYSMSMNALGNRKTQTTNNLTDMTDAVSDNAKSSKKEFKIHVIKDFKYDRSERDREEKEKAEKEQEENRQRKRAVEVLEKHGVTQSNILMVSRRASFQRKESSNSIQSVNDMIQHYRQDIEDYKQRIYELEQKEVARLAKETSYREELFNNHGKPADYFKVPALFTRTRSNSRRFKKLTQERETAEQLLQKRQIEQKKASERGGKYVLGKEHDDLVKLIRERQSQLNQLMRQEPEIAAKNVALGSRKDNNVYSSEHSDDQENVEQFIKFQDGNEIQLDLSVIKAQRNKNRGSNSVSNPSKDISANTACTTQLQKSWATQNSFSSSSSCSDDSSNEGENSRKQNAPKINITSGDLEVDRINNDAQREHARSEAKQKRPQQLSTLKVTANFERRRRSSTNSLRACILKPEQIILNHEHTKAEPFNFHTEQRLAQKKASIYQRNAERYQKEVNNSLRSQSAAGRAQRQLADFQRSQENKLNNTHIEDYVKQRQIKLNQKLEPMALFVDRQGLRVSKNASPKSSNRSRSSQRGIQSSN